MKRKSFRGTGEIPPPALSGREETLVIEVTKINGVKILVNPHLFEVVEETPDTVITLTTGKKFIVKESRQEIKNLVELYRKGFFTE